MQQESSHWPTHSASLRPWVLAKILRECKVNCLTGEFIYN